MVDVILQCTGTKYSETVLYGADPRLVSPLICYPFLTLRLTTHRSLVDEHGES